jgi:hypothetical protein
MSSLFTRSEIALADLALAALDGRSLDVAVGGLGLGYTARAVLQNPAVRSLRVVEALADVVDWHRRALVPLGAELTAISSRSSIRPRSIRPRPVAASTRSWSTSTIRRPRCCIPHMPASTAARACAASEHLRSSGVFGLWSDDPPDAAFQAELDAVFARSQAHVVRFAHPLQDLEAACTVYIAHGFAIA